MDPTKPEKSDKNGIKIEHNPSKNPVSFMMEVSINLSLRHVLTFNVLNNVLSYVKDNFKLLLSYTTFG